MMIPTVMSLVTQFIIQPEIVNLTKQYEKKMKNEFELNLKKIIKKLIFFSILCIILAMTLGPFFLGLLYQLDFKNYRLAFVLLILAGSFNGLSSIYSNALTILRITKKQFDIYVLVLILNFILSYFLSKIFNLNGVFISLLLVMLLQYILFYIIYKYNKKTNFN